MTQTEQPEDGLQKIALTQEELQRLVHYDKGTGLFSSKTSRRFGNLGNYNKAGYLWFSLNGSAYYSHRLAFLYMTGEFPKEGQTIDHINGKVSDNRWENLRICSIGENSYNAKTRQDNKTGIKGLTFIKRGKTANWTAGVKFRGHSYRKTLVNSSGSIEEENLIVGNLISWLRETRERLHKTFTNHGD